MNRARTIGALLLAIACGASAAEESPGFVDRIKDAGVTWVHRGVKTEIENRFNLYDHGSGIAVADVDQDGKDDVYLLSMVGESALLRNKGDGTFEDVAVKAGVAMRGKVCVAAGFGDYDNDGYPDLFVATTRGGNHLLHNEKNGTFKDVTKAAKVEHVGHSGTVCWLDYDGDGALDLYVGNTGKYTTESFDQASQSFVGTPLDLIGWTVAPRERALLYRNKKDGSFEEVAQEAGAAGRGWVSDATACDYDGDGHVDLYVSRMFGDNQLLRNTGKGAFEDVTAKVLGRTSVGAMGARWADADNDGRADLYVVDMHSDMWIPDVKLPQIDDRKRYEGPSGPIRMPRDQKEKLLKAWDNPVGLFGNTFFHQKADGSFEEVSQAAGLENFWPWGIAAGDYDGNGFVDFFIPCGMGYPWDYRPNYLLMNEGGLKFADRAKELGVEPRLGGPSYGEPVKERVPMRSSRAAVTADFDGDGRLDLFVNNFNHEPSYLHNELPKTSWLAVRLVGKKANRDAVGAKVVVRAGGASYTRWVDGGGGYLAESSKVLHFGLKDAKDVDEVEVTWPGKRVQTVKKPQIDTLMKIEEK